MLELFKVLSTAKAFGRVFPEHIEQLKQNGVIVTNPDENEEVTEEYLARVIPEFDGLILSNGYVTKKVINNAVKLKIIAKHGVGVNEIDLDAAAERGIFVTNAPGCNDSAVADLTFGLMLAACRQIPLADKATRNGEWPRFLGYEVQGKTLGVIGLGSIGKGVARRSQGFMMKLLGYDVFQDTQFAEEVGLKYVQLEELLSTADFITVHVPLMESTRNLIGTREFSLMKPSAFLINTARGTIVDEAALYDALANKRIAGAATDVYAVEPAGTDNPLFKLSNLVLTPHLGAYTYEAIHAVGTVIVENILAVIRGKEPGHIVNPKHTAR
jgi:D-3-phosphoglycerate dehydrogenase